MILNYIAVAVGLIICFGGIVLKKTTLALNGFLDGAILGAVIFLFSIERLSSLSRDKEDIILPIIICGIIIAVLSIVFERISIAIQSFLSSFAALMIILIVILSSLIGLTGVLILCIIFSTIIAVIAYRIGVYAYIIMTSFSGAVIASVGAAGIVRELTLYEILANLYKDAFWGVISDDTSFVAVFVTIGTIILFFLGFNFQKKRFLSNPDSNSESNDSDSKPASQNTAVLNDVIQKSVNAAKNAVNKITEEGPAAAPNSVKTLSLKAWIIIDVAVFVCYIIADRIRYNYSALSFLYGFTPGFIPVNIATGIMTAVLIYLALFEERKKNIAFHAIYIVFTFVHYSVYFSIFFIILYSKSLISYGLTRLEIKKIKNRKYLLYIIMVTSSFIMGALANGYTRVTAWINDYYPVDLFVILDDFLLCSITAFAVEFFMFKFLRGKNLFKYDWQDIVPVNHTINNNGFSSVERTVTSTPVDVTVHSQASSVALKETEAASDISMSTPKRCPKCGAEVAKMAVFCGKCGSKI